MGDETAAEESGFARVAAVCALLTALTTLPIHLIDFPADSLSCSRKRVQASSSNALCAA